MIGPDFLPRPKEGPWLAVCVGVLGSTMTSLTTLILERRDVLCPFLGLDGPTIPFPRKGVDRRPERRGGR